MKINKSARLCRLSTPRLRPAATCLEDVLVSGIERTRRQPLIFDVGFVLDSLEPDAVPLAFSQDVAERIIFTATVDRSLCRLLNEHVFEGDTAFTRFRPTLCKVGPEARPTFCGNESAIDLKRGKPGSKDPLLS